jgi:hypothetical protein
VAECNSWAQLSIKNAQFVAESIYKSDDKFDYLQAILNMELQSANKHSKIYEPDPVKYMVNVQASLKCYKRACDFVKEYMKDKELTAP